MIRAWLLALLILLPCPAPAAAAAGQRISLPKPTGPHRVGRTRLELADPTRPEEMTEDPADRRRLMLHIWYPAAAQGGASARYVEIDPADPVYRKSYAFVGVDKLAAVATNSFEGAPLSSAGRRYPVLLFSHGLGMVSSLYSALLENLASARMEAGSQDGKEAGRP